MNLPQIKTWLFDCDGVILDSNSIKTDTFYEVALPYGKSPADKFVAYHKQHGGVSRYEKFHHFFVDILNKEQYSADLSASLESYGRIVQKKMMTVPETAGFRQYIQSIPDHCNKFVVSGGDEEEIREIFHLRGLDRFFNGIFGSPRDKKEIMRSLIESGQIIVPTVFVGDSRFDYEVAQEFGFDFIFLSRYSEFLDWPSFFADKQDVLISDSFETLIQHNI